VTRIFPVLFLMLPACQPTAEPEPECAGGRIVHGGMSGLPLCVRPTGDAGQSCTQISDCEGYCLAKTNSCAPEAPMYGCFEVLLAPGDPVTVCLD